LAVLLGLALVALGLLGVSSAANLPLAGSLDPSFGSGGVVTHSLGSNGYPIFGGIAVQPDGKIVVAGGGSVGVHGPLLARYLPNGSPDPSFGVGGYVETPSAYWSAADAVALQPDGKIVVAGRSSAGDPNAVSEFMLARYNPDGSLDISFGTDGITNTAIPEPGTSWNAAASALAVLPDGKIVAAGSAGWGVFGPCFPPSMFALARYTPEGTLDPTFGDGGVVQTAFYGQDGLAGIAVQPNGTIVASGAGDGGFCLARHRLQHVVTAPGITTMALAWYQPNGSLEGTVTTDARLNYSGGPPVLQNGKIFVTGNESNRDYLVIARYKTGDLVLTRIRSVIGYPTAALAQKDGKILVAVSNGQQGTGTLVRLLLTHRAPNLRLDPSFGNGGIVSLPASISFPALALQRDQKVLAGGGESNTWTLARLIGGNNCIVPNLRGKTVAKATTALTKSYCRRGGISKRFSNKVARGLVMSNAPLRGTRLRGGTKIDLVVSKGKRP
jgi:uncharacterized delta-60 repeat protein